MNLHNNTSWFFSVFASVLLFAGGSFIIADDSYSMESETIHFSDLSDDDIDMILAVKAEMLEARTRAN